MRRVLALSMGVLLLAPASLADGIEVGAPAPALPEASWVLAPEAPTLEGLRGHLVLLHVWGEGQEGRARPWLDLWQEAFWKEGVRVLALARCDGEALDLAVRQRAFAYPVACANALGAYAAETAVLVAPDGAVAWTGKLDEIDRAVVAKLLRKVKVPPMKESAEAGAAWTELAERSAEVGAPALAVHLYDRIEKAFKGLPEAAAAIESEKELKRSKQAKKEIAAARSLVSIATEWLKVGDNERRQQALVKKIGKFLSKHEGTRSATHAQLLLGHVRGGAAVGAIEDFIAETGIDTRKSSWRTNLPKPPKVEFEATRTYFWVLQTSEGSIRIRLMPDVAPMHVSSTIYLTVLGFYDGLTFHRVIPGFMAQGGCPTGTGAGSPGYKYAGEFDRAVRHDRGGLLSMANAGPGTDGSQFFITFKATRHLDDKHTIFGEVVSGMDAVQKLEAEGTQGGAPKKRLVIEKATIEVE